MGARKLAIHVAAGCPFVLLLGMGITVRRAVGDHTTLKYSEAQNARIEAYGSLMLQVPALTAHIPVLERYADSWIQIAPAAKLQPLAPAFQEESEAENPRTQIIQTWTTLLERLVAAMPIEINRQQPSVAIREATRVVRLAEILKYSDFETLGTANFCTVRALTLTEGLIRAATPQEKSALRHALANANRSRFKLSQLYRLLRGNREDYLLRNGGPGPIVASDRNTGHADDTDNDVSGEELQRRYVIAIRDEVRLRAASRKAIAVALNSAKW